MAPDARVEIPAVAGQGGKQVQASGLASGEAEELQVFEGFGSWNNTYKRFARWCEAGVWEAVFAALSQGGDFDLVAYPNYLRFTTDLTQNLTPETRIVEDTGRTWLWPRPDQEPPPGGCWPGTAPEASVVGVRIGQPDGHTYPGTILDGINWAIENRFRRHTKSHLLLLPLTVQS